MLGAMAHVGITVRDMDTALAFYRDTLGLRVLGDIMIAGDEADRLTRLKGTQLRAV
jgi:catechol 2,3-dioxygenase-like lactoylglutathione lyase family enzyme